MSDAAQALAREPLRHTLHVNGLDLAAWEWPGAGDPILLIHATGFHARCWQTVVEALPGRHVFALDMPSHGASARRPPPCNWTHFGADVRGAVEALGLARVLGVGHSMGGYALVLAAAAEPQRFRGLILVDPVIVEPAVVRAVAGRRAADHPISRRRNRWQSPAQMFASFSRKAPYSQWDARVLRDYCRYGLRPAADGEGFELACPPDLEAEIYVTIRMDDILPALAHVTMPVEIIRARSRRPEDKPHDFSPSPTMARLAQLLPDATDEQLADCSHFIPMERPQWMAERILRCAARLGGAGAEPVELSLFAQRFCGPSGVVDLMQDLASALELHPDMIFMGGGNPARVPAAEALFRERLGTLLADPGQLHEVLGVYQSPQGDERFRDALAAMLHAQCGWEVERGNIAVANGSQSAFFVLFNLFAGAFSGARHKHIRLPLVPEYIGYREAGLSDGMFRASRPAIRPLPDQLFKYGVDFAALRPDDAAGALCVSRPTNPTGNVLSDAEIRELDALARARGIPLIIDGAYGMPFPGMVSGTATPHWNDNVVLLLSLSKLGLPGLRTGIVVAREEIVEAFARANTIMSLACGNVGPALATVLIEDGSLMRLAREQIGPFYRDRMARALDGMRRAIAGLPCRVHTPEGAMFLWLWCEGIAGGSRALYQRLKQRGVLVVPGRDFFPGLAEPWAHTDECIRVSCAQDDALVARGIAIIGNELRRSYGA